MYEKLRTDYILKRVHTTNFWRCNKLHSIYFLDGEWFSKHSIRYYIEVFKLKALWFNFSYTGYSFQITEDYYEPSLYMRDFIKNIWYAIKTYKRDFICITD